MMTSVRSSLMMCLDDAEVKRKHVCEFMSNNPVPRLLSHKEVPKKNESNRHS